MKNPSSEIKIETRQTLGISSQCLKIVAEFARNKSREYEEGCKVTNESEVFRHIALMLEGMAVGLRSPLYDHLKLSGYKKPIEFVRYRNAHVALCICLMQSSQSLSRYAACKKIVNWFKVIHLGEKNIKRKTLENQTPVNEPDEIKTFLEKPENREIFDLLKAAKNSDSYDENPFAAVLALVLPLWLDMRNSEFTAEFFADLNQQADVIARKINKKT